MTKDEAAELLGVVGDYSASDVKRAFRALAKEGHADHGGVLDIDQLKRARDILLHMLDTGHTRYGCRRCGGTGYIQHRGRFDAVPCPECTGE